MSESIFLDQSLDDIITAKQQRSSRNANRNASKAGGPARSNNSRTTRSSKPYDGSMKKHSKSSNVNKEGWVHIKFLVTNAIAGVIIGKGGENIRRMIDKSEAQIRVSGTQEHFPDTEHRICQISGSDMAVVRAQSMIWEIIATGKEDDEDAAPTRGHRIDRIQVEGTIAIPAASAGYIIGRQGASIQAIEDESGASFMMSTKEEAVESQERVITISGTTAQCSRFVSMLVAKLADSEDSTYVYEVGHYNRVTEGRRTNVIDSSDNSDGSPPNSRSMSRVASSNQMVKQREGGGRTVQPGSRNDSNSRVRGSVMTDNFTGLEVLSAMTTYSLAVDDELIGVLVGSKGVHVREIMNKSGAVVSLSPKGEFVKGTTNRVVTVAGNPQSAHYACELISERLKNEA